VRLSYLRTAVRNQLQTARSFGGFEIANIARLDDVLIRIFLHGIATARAELTTAMVVRADYPIISDDAVIELLVDLRHFCGTVGQG
jgi:hypothetical protein